MLRLENKALSLGVEPEKGGAIASLERIVGGKRTQLLYTSDGPGWTGGAPWMFPAVGRSRADGKPGFWRLDERIFPMPIHGFAGSQRWDGSADGESISCRTESGPPTRLHYPFDYTLEVVYRLSSAGLSATVEVSAGQGNTRPMPFSLGNHLTLKAPSPKDCWLRAPASQEWLLSEAGLLTGKTRPAALGSPVLLSADRRWLDCVLSGFPPGEAWVEVVDPGSFGVRVSQRELLDAGRPARTRPEHFCFVFYGDASGAFFCPEPWYGRPNSLNERQGVVELEPGGRFRWEMALELI